MLLFFFFSSRRRHTRSKRDWSSDVCSSDLRYVLIWRRARAVHRARAGPHQNVPGGIPGAGAGRDVHDERLSRSEERRVGKECRSRWRGVREKEMARTDRRHWTRWQTRIEVL